MAYSDDDDYPGDEQLNDYDDTYTDDVYANDADDTYNQYDAYTREEPAPRAARDTSRRAERRAHPVTTPRSVWATGDGFAQRALDWGISGSMLAILLLTAVYAFSPADAVPDLVPVAGQVNDLAAVLAGGGTIGFLVVLRFRLRTRIGRWGWPLAIVLSAIASFAAFYALAQIFDALLR